MVNVIIYLNEKNQAKDLVEFLLRERLIASASIDVNNTSYSMVDGQIKEEVYSVITAQSKALLVSDIIKAVESRIEGEVPINSVPIVGTNRAFDNKVKTNTISI